VTTTYNDPVALYNQVGFIYDQSVVVIDRTATGTGAGTQTAVGLITRIRTATGSGAGTSNNSIAFKLLRTAQGSGGAGTGDTAVPEVIPVRTATATGTGGSSATATFFSIFTRTATASGTGASTATRLVISPRTATGSGAGTSTAIKAQFVARTATGSGIGAQSAISVRLVDRDGTGSGVGDYVPSVWVKSRIFRVPADDDYPFVDRLGTSAADRLFSYTPQGVRARNLYKLTDGTYSLTDPRRPERVVKVYYGGHNIFLEDSEVTELTAAGYGAYIT
jgi:hypothetical protein